MQHVELRVVPIVECRRPRVPPLPRQTKLPARFTCCQPDTLQYVICAAKEPPYEGDINNSETLDHAILVSTHTFTARRAHQEPRALSPHSHGLRVLTLTSPRASPASPVLQASGLRRSPNLGRRPILRRRTNLRRHANLRPRPSLLPCLQPGARPASYHLVPPPPSFPSRTSQRSLT